MNTSTRTHSIFDYAFGLFLILSPWLLGFGEAEAETLAPMVIGMLIVCYSFFTDYEGGMYRRMPYAAHLTFDLILGVALATSPWVFNFDEKVYRPHLVMGIIMVGVAILSFNVMTFIKLYLRRNNASQTMKKIHMNHSSRLRTN